MKIDFDIVDSVRTLINVPAVNALVSAIRPIEAIPSDYSAKSKFITIALLAGDFAQLQSGFVNINIYAPDIVTVPDYNALKTITNIVLPLVNDVYVNEMYVEINQTPKTIRDQEITGYHFSSIKLKFFNPNLN